MKEPPRGPAPPAQTILRTDQARPSGCFLYLYSLVTEGILSEFFSAPVLGAAEVNVGRDAKEVVKTQ